MRLIEFAIACLLIEITPGPNMSYLTALAFGQGAKAGFQAVLGVACGLLTVGLLAATGLAQILSAYPVINTFLRWGGIVFMLWLAVESWMKAEAGVENESSSRLGTFWRGLTTNLLNPKLVIFYIAMLPDFVDQKSGNLFLQNVVLVLIYTGIATIIHTVLVIFAVRVRQFTNLGRNVKMVRRVMACLLLGVAAWLFMEVRP
ncbi:MAG TPA: LysE family translocator [Alphaproteobacteria bacterium]|nr:LysE family translocator [Alphaproteobacteria bacterium]